MFYFVIGFFRLYLCLFLPSRFALHIFVCVMSYVLVVPPERRQPNANIYGSSISRILYHSFHPPISSQPSSSATAVHGSAAISARTAAGRRPNAAGNRQRVQWSECTQKSGGPSTTVQPPQPQQQSATACEDSRQFSVTYSYV